MDAAAKYIGVVIMRYIDEREAKRYMLPITSVDVYFDELKEIVSIDQLEDAAAQLDAWQRGSVRKVV